MKKALLPLFFILWSCSSSPEAPGLPPVRVQVAEVKEAEAPVYIEAIGNVYENSIVQIRPQVQGILLRAYAAQGQFVKQGDLLYEIDPRPYQAVLDQAKGTLLKDQAALELAKNTLQRNKELMQKQFISPLTYEQYETNVASLEAQIAIDKAAIESAQINLDYCRIFSPINGKISAYNIYPGNLVVVNDPNALTEIRQISPVDVRFSIPQRDFERLQPYLTKDLTFQAFLPEGTTPFVGTLYFVDNHLDLQTGTIMLRGSIQNKEHLLWPGEFVRVRIVLKSEHVMLAPASAVEVGQKGQFVYVVQPDMTIKMVPVTVGDPFDSYIPIYSGVHAGDKVITNGQLNLRTGSKVTIVDGEL